MKNYNEKVMDDFIENNLIGKEVIISSLTSKNRRYYSGVLLSLCNGFALLDTQPSGYTWLISLNNMDIREDL